MLTIAFHEFGHAITGVCTGAKIKSISLDPREGKRRQNVEHSRAHLAHTGGVTVMSGGISAITLPAGYLGSSAIGALLVFAGFNMVASKIASLILGVCFLFILWWAKKDWLTVRSPSF